MRLLVTGLRGFPNILGGIESHCENLYPLLNDPQVEIAVVRRARYVTDDSVTFSGVKFVDLWSPRSGSLETIVHTFLSILYGVYWRADIIHIHAIGPGLLAPMARLLGMKVVLTHHGAIMSAKSGGVSPSDCSDGVSFSDAGGQTDESPFQSIFDSTSVIRRVPRPS